MTELWQTYFDPIAAGNQGTQGIPGNDATAVDVGTWQSGHDFVQGDRCYHAKTGYGQCVYRAKSSHTSAAGDEPEVGASWATYWELFAEGGQDGAGTGDVVGPASSVTNDDVGFADVSGKLLKSMGAFATRLAAAIAAMTASTTATDGDVDKIPVLEAGGQKIKTIDSIFKRYVPVNIPAGAFITTGTTGCGLPSSIEIGTDVNDRHNYKSCAFSNSSKTYGWANFNLPIGYTGGAIKAYIHWYSDGVTSDGVRFGVQGNAIGDNETLSPTWGTAVEVTDNATGTANRLLKTGIMDNITLGGTPLGGKKCTLRFYRDTAHGDDNLAALIYIVDIDLLIPINKQSEV